MLAFRKAMICISAIALLPMAFRASIGAGSDESRATSHAVPTNVNETASSPEFERDGAIGSGEFPFRAFPDAQFSAPDAITGPTRYPYAGDESETGAEYDAPHGPSPEWAAKVALGNNANAVLTLDLIADGGAGNQRDDGVTAGAVQGRGTIIAIEVFATGVTTALRGVVIRFDFDPSLVTFVKAENSAFGLSIPEGSVGVNLASTAPVTLARSGFLARAEFETAADVTGREFTIGIEKVTVAESATSSDELTTGSVITFNAAGSASPDFDGDGTVSLSDFLAFAGSFGSSQGDARYEARFDLDGDGAVALSDFLIFAGAFGSEVPPSGGAGTTPPTYTSQESFNLHDDNQSPQGIAYANGRFFVPDRKWMYAYRASGQRDVAAEFDLHYDNPWSTGIAYANGRFFVPDEYNYRVYAYRASGQRDVAAEFDLHDDNDWPRGIAYANGRFFVPDGFYDRVYAYRASGQRDVAAEFDLHDDNDAPRGIAYANEMFYVVDSSDDKVYVYSGDSGGNGGGGGGSGSSPDLIVEPPSVDDNTLTTGQSFTLSATVRNQGNASSASTTLRYYRSSNATISTNDTEVGTDAVSSLSPGGTSAESISLNAPSDAGTYYYGACVDDVSDESDTDNNCSDAVDVTVSGGGGGSGGACRAGLVVNPGETCTYKGNTFSVSSSGRGSIAFFSAGTGIDARGANINGVRWNFHATKNSGSNSWTIHVAD